MSLEKLERILVPTDFSELSEHALKLAERLAKATDAELYALKIIQPPGEVLFDPEGELLECDEYDITQLEAEKKEEEVLIKEWVEKTIDSPVRTQVMVGRLIEDGIRFIQENNIDLLVMGTHGSKGLRQWLGGSMAEKFVRYSEAPLLSLKCDRSGMDFSRILLASDLSEPEGQHLEVVKQLQEAFGSELHLLRIRKEKEDEEAIRKRMEEFVARNDLKNVVFNIHQADDVEDGILAYANSEGIDLIAIGNHGRTGIGHLFTKSISEDVVNHIFHPILTYRIDQKKQ